VDKPRLDKTRRAEIYTVPDSDPIKFSKRLRAAAGEYTLTLEELSELTCQSPKLVEDMLVKGGFGDSVRVARHSANDDVRFNSAALPRITLYIELWRLSGHGEITTRGLKRTIDNVGPFMTRLWRNSLDTGLPCVVKVKVGNRFINLKFLRDAAILWASAAPSLPHRHAAVGTRSAKKQPAKKRPAKKQPVQPAEA